MQALDLSACPHKQFLANLKGSHKYANAHEAAVPEVSIALSTITVMLPGL